MVGDTYFSARPAIHPQIYAYSLPGVPDHAGYLKVGYTEREVEARILEQLGTAAIPHRTEHVASAMRQDGSCFTDHDVHRVLEKWGKRKLSFGGRDNEWYRCTVADVKAAIIAVRDGTENIEVRSADFPMRPEQQRIVQRTMDFYREMAIKEPGRTPKFLWNCKMRFGKTFATYQLAKRMGFKRVLVLTFKPAVESAWREDLLTHVDFEGWQFISNKDAHNNDISIDQQFLAADHSRPIVVFGSFQDLLGTNDAGGIKPKNEFIHAENWDLVVFDEYHYGAWRENARRLFDMPDEEAGVDFDVERYKRDEADSAINESWIAITANHYLYLSGTPFRAINSGEFIEEQIQSWTYSDEQAAKRDWTDPGPNPYESLPRMVMMTYRIPDAIRRIAQEGEFDEFDLNLFFSAEVPKGGNVEEARFKYENEVQKWLDLIRGSYMPATRDELHIGERPPMPFSDSRLLGVLQHTLWFLPNVASCYAMRNLLAQRQNTFYRDYRVIVCAGTKAGIGLDALYPVQEAMGDPLATKTITLSCGKLTTGVTVKPWSGIFMLRNLKSPETYFQAAFRVQSPWVVRGDDGHPIIMKRDCYVFDFALDRALHQIADYACQLNTKDSDPEQNVGEFISFLPVLAYDGAKMTAVTAEDILDFTTAGTSATLLAKRWESALLVNVDNDTLARLQANPEAMAALMKIEGFRSLNSDIQTIINRSEAIKKAKRDKGDDMPEKEKKKISEEEKKLKSLRKQIQEKLIKFATRVPIFMYLSEYRERCLRDVITLLEPRLFKLTTGLDVKDFELLCSLNIFNGEVMNQAIWQFKRYEDASLEYTGINRHEDEENVGGWDTVIRREEFDALFAGQQQSMAAPVPSGAPRPRPAPETAASPIAPARQTVSAKPAQPSAPSIPMKPATAPASPVAPFRPVTPAMPMTPRPAAPAAAQSTAAEKPHADVSGIKTGSLVVHKAFGEGVVESLDIRDGKQYIYVRFAGGAKQFQFPKAFDDGFLWKK